MAQASAQLSLSLAPLAAMQVCQQAAQQLVMAGGWTLKEQSAGRLIIVESLKLSLTNTTNPVTIEVLVTPVAAGSTVQLNGSNMGWGPIQTGGIRQRLQTYGDLVQNLAGSPMDIGGPQASPADPGQATDSAPSLLDRLSQWTADKLAEQEDAAPLEQTPASVSQAEADFVEVGLDLGPDDLIDLGANNIFLSYRRDDSADVTGRIYDRLIGAFGPDPIFKDVDSIPFGVDFRQYLADVVGKCQVVLVIIGRDWVSISDDKGRRRLDDPADFVRIEVESALQRGVPVIPLLVRGAQMPQASELPESLASLAFRNGTAIRRDPDFHTDMDRLIEYLEKQLGA